MTIEQAELAEPLLAKASEYLPQTAVAKVKAAYEFAAGRPAGQLRKSGDPVIPPPLHAAQTIAALQLDADTIVAALLHDVQEDCAVENKEIERQFGATVAKLVEGVTKLGKIPWQTGEALRGDDQIQAENLRKMFLAMARARRVVIIKLADRLHNMLTLSALPPEDQQRISRETMEIYAPLASRLGIWEMKWQLEDLAFHYLDPEGYKTIAGMLDAKRDERERYVARVKEILIEELAQQGIKAEIQGRAKHIYSIYQKIEKYASERRGTGGIYDLLAVRILVETVTDCYSALGVVHGLWRPLPGAFDDYIANPKESMYQALHTTVMSLDTRPLEVQIRTYEMHRSAEYGVAAHWRYKEGSKRDLHYEERLGRGERSPGRGANEPRPRQDTAVVQAAGAGGEHRPRAGDAGEGVAPPGRGYVRRRGGSAEAVQVRRRGRLRAAGGLRRNQHSPGGGQAGAAAAAGGGGGGGAAGGAGPRDLHDERARAGDRGPAGPPAPLLPPRPRR